MRILVLSDGWPPYKSGGAETIAQNLSNAYVQDGHEVCVVTTEREQASPPGIQPVFPGLSRTTISTSYPKLLRPYLGLWNPGPVSRLPAILRKFRPDVAHAHNVHRYLSYKSLKMCQDAQIPVLLTLHDAMSVDYGRFTQGMDEKSGKPDGDIDYRVRLLPTLKRYHIQYFPLRNRLIRAAIAEWTDLRYAVSGALCDFLRGNGIPVDGCIHTGVDPEEFSGPTSAGSGMGIRERHNLDRRPILSIVGRLTLDKGCLSALKALKEVRAMGHDAVLALLGGTRGECPQFDRAVDQLGLADAVCYAGWLSGSELHNAYHETDVVLVPFNLSRRLSHRRPGSNGLRQTGGRDPLRRREGSSGRWHYWIHCQPILRNRTRGQGQTATKPSGQSGSHGSRGQRANSSRLQDR